MPSFAEMTRLISRLGYVSKDSGEITVMPLSLEEISSDSRYLEQAENIQNALWPKYGAKDIRTLVDSIRPKGNKRFHEKMSGYMIAALEGAGEDSVLRGFFIADPDTPKIMGGRLLGVDPNFQGKGTGKRLLHALMNYSERDGYELISLPFDLSNNVAAGLYLGNGGIITQYYPNLYGIKGNRGVIEMPLKNERTKNLVAKNQDLLSVELQKDYRNLLIFNEADINVEPGIEFLIKKPSRADEFGEHFAKATKDGFGATRFLELDGEQYYYFENCTSLLNKAMELHKNGSTSTAFSYVDLAMYLAPDNEKVVNYFETLYNIVNAREKKLTMHIEPQSYRSTDVKGFTLRSFPKSKDTFGWDIGSSREHTDFDSLLNNPKLDRIKIERQNYKTWRDTKAQAYYAKNICA